MDSDDRLVMTCFAIVFGGGVLIVCLAVFGTVALYRQLEPIVEQTVQVAALTQNVQQTEARGTFSAELVQSEATERAYQGELESAQNLLKAAKGWEIVFKETFDNNDNDWFDAPVAFSRVVGDIHISDGKYYWDLEAKDGFVYYDYPEMEVLSDFYLEVETEQISGSEIGKHGLIFRRASSSYYYYFSITEDQRYKVSLRRAGSWERVIPSTYSEEIQPGQPNRLAVIGIEQKVYFFINDKFIDFVDTSVSIRGNVGIFTSLGMEGDLAEYVFDNFEVRVPPAK